MRISLAENATVTAFSHHLPAEPYLEVLELLDLAHIRTLILAALTVGVVYISSGMIQHLLMATVFSPLRRLQKPPVKAGSGFLGKLVTAIMGNLPELQEQDPGVKQMEVSVAKLSMLSAVCNPRRRRR